MSAKYIVALKLHGKVNPMCFGGCTYMKTRPVEDDSELATPTIGKRYFTCHLLTSPVVNYKPYGGGWEVETENSLYRFFFADREVVETIAKENGFTGPRRINDGSHAEYWSQSIS
ncbi:MAG: hypothetical protein ACWGQW_01690 [bacterium]